MISLKPALSLLCACFMAATTAPAISASEAGAGDGADTLNWVGCGISKRGFMNDLAKAYEKKTGIGIDIAGGGATKGLRWVHGQKSELGGSCRLPLIYQNQGRSSIDEKEDRIKLIPVGWDALVVIVNKENKWVESISRDQLIDVLQGKITNWRELGADADEPINLYIRKGKISGVVRTLRQQLFNNVDEEFSEKATVLPSSGKIEKALEKDRHGLAVSGISSSRHRDVRILKLDGIYPTMETLKNKEYTLYRILFLVVPPDYEEQAPIKQFVDFALSLEGQEIIQDAGTLPYHKGIGLLYKAASADYIQNIEVIDRHGLYTLGGH